MSTWIQTKDREPKPGETILAHVRDCKLGEFFVMTVRDDEGTAFIDEYTILGDKAEPERDRERLSEEDASNSVSDSLNSTYT